MGRHDDERKRRRSSRDDDDERKRRRHKSSRHDDDERAERRSRKKDDRKEKSRRRKEYCSEEEDASSSSSSSHHRHRKRRKKEKKHRRKREKKDKKRRRRESRIEESDEDMTEFERNYAFADALQSLLELQSGMASELPALLIQLADGRSFNLSQMPGALRSSLENVLSSFSPFGVEKDESGSWVCKTPGRPREGASQSLLLLKIARTLLDQIGVTMDAVESYSEKKKPARMEEQERMDEDDTTEATNALIALTDGLLEQFGKKRESEGPTLAQELGSLCSMILDGECIALDGLPDEALRKSIERLFLAAGLEKAEIEESDDDDDDESSTGEIHSMGYGLPDGDQILAKANMTAVQEACKAAGTSSVKRRAVRGPARMPPREGETVHVEDHSITDDDEGPAPVGSEKARRRVQRGPIMPPEVVKAMAERRKRELDGVVTGEEQLVPGEREQWMVEPGEHDFLQGIKSGAPMKSRGFQNKKQSNAARAPAQVDPSVQAEMDAIMKLHRDARGESLMEQHRAKKAEEKAEAAKAGKAEWKWSRDKDLDAGRRVDKNALNMVMGGAADKLKDKFQGGFSGE